MQHPAKRSEEKRSLSGLFGRPESLPLFLSILFFAILYGAGPDLRSSKFIFDPPWLLLVLNTVFVMGLCLLIAWLCFRSFLRGGFLNVLLLGCGVLIFGLTSFAAGWLIRPPHGLNEALTIRNVGVLCTAAFFFLSSLITAFGISLEIELRRGLIAVMAYTAVLGLGAILTAEALLDLIPPFFIAGEGPTVLRQVILAVSVTLFTLSAILLMRVYSERKTGSAFLLYSINSLLLLGTGIVGVGLGVPGSPMSWLGRAAQYTGTVYLVVASMQALSEARSSGTTVEKALADFFRKSETHYRALIEMAADPIISIDREGKIILTNPAAEEKFGYGQGEAAGRDMEKLMVPEQSRDSFHACLARESCRDMDMELARKDGSIFPAELSFSPEMEAEGGSARTIIIRDVTERRQAEEALRSAALFPIQNPDPVLRIHRDGTLLFSNPAAETALQEWRAASGTGFPAQVRQAVEAALNEGEPREIERRIAGRDFSFVVTPIAGSHYANLYGRDVTERNRVEEALRRNEANMARAQKIARLGSWGVDAATQKVTASREIFDLFDVGPGPHTLDVFLDKMHPDDKAMIRKKITESEDDHRPYQFEYRVMTRKGQRVILTIGETGYSAQGAPEAFFGIAQDITERRQAEESLRASYELLHIAQRAANAGIWAWEISTGKLQWSEEFYVLFGLDPKTAASFGAWLGVLHPDDRQPAMERINRSIRSGVPLENEYRIFRPDGQERWIREWGNPFYDLNGTPLSMSSICIDVTESKRAGEALRRSEQRYRSYIEVTGQLGWTADADGEIVEDSPCWRTFTGQAVTEMRGRGWAAALHPDDVEITLAVWRKSVEEKQGYETEFRLRRHDGVYRYFLARGVPVLNDDGSVREWVGSCVDITERYQAEEALKASEEALRLANEGLEQRVRERTAELMLLLEDLEKSRGELRKLASELVLAEERERKKISVALHDEVAQTLAAARMRVDLLRSKPGGEESRRVLDEAQQLLVQAIRETRALMTDISNPVLYDMGLQVAVQSLTEEVKAAKGISVSSSFSGSLRNLDQDLEVMIYQVVKELVQNIVKHSGAGTASVRIVEKGDVVKLVVADDGQGFDAGNVGAVGLDGGFGLFSIRERVKSYGGKVRIASEPGKGSEVTVLLPKRTAGIAASQKTGKRKEGI